MSKGKKSRAASGRLAPAAGPVARKELGAPPVLPKWLDALLKPHNAFGILALVFGSAFIVTTPPFQVPDEAAHFFRTFSLSEFDVAQDVEGTQTGDVLPSSLDSAASIFNYLKFVPANKVPDGQITAAMKIALEPGNRKFMQVSAGNYIYPCYIPQLPAVWIGKILRLNVLHILYLGRFFALLFYVFLVAWAIRAIPSGKYLLMAVALMPMCLAQAGSFSPDVVSFAFAFLSLSLLLKQAASREPLRLTVETALTGFMLVMMGVLKPVFLPVALLVFLLPQQVFASRKTYALATLLTIITAAILALGWLKLMASFGTLQTGVDINGRPIDPSGKMSRLMQDPMLYAAVVRETIGYFGKMYFQSTIGIIGYLDTYMPKGVYTAFSVLIAGLAVFESEKKVALTIRQRALLLGVSIGVFLGTILALFLYTREKSNLVAEGGQGRYFIPVLFTFLMTFHGLVPVRISLSRKPLLAASLYLVLLILLVIAQVTLHQRFYA